MPKKGYSLVLGFELSRFNCIQAFIDAFIKLKDCNY
jgi:hypothetical protein